MRKTKKPNDSVDAKQFRDRSGNRNARAVVRKERVSCGDGSTDESQVPSNRDKTAASGTAPSAFYIGELPKPKAPSESFKYRSHFLADELPRVFVPKYICDKTGGGYPAIFASQLAYWNQEMAAGGQRLNGDGDDKDRAWTPTYKGIFRQTGITKDKARHARQNLKSSKLITCRAQQSNANHFFLTADFKAELGEAGVLSRDNRPAGTLVRATEVLITKTGNQAIIIASILPWFVLSKQGRIKLCIYRDGHWWRANTYTQLSEETGLSTHQAKRAIIWLRDEKLIHTMHAAFKGRRTLHVRPNLKVINHRLVSALQKLDRNAKSE